MNIIIGMIAGWVGLVVAGYGVAWWLSRGPGRDPLFGLLWRVTQVYLRIVHRARYRGLEHVPRSFEPGGLIVVANHMSGIDPLLIQAACPFMLRWLMAEEMMATQLDWLWRLLRIIPVARDGKDLAPVREAIREVRGGGVVGIFPEGGIVPTEEIRPFYEGVGLIIARAKAPVLLCLVEGAPRTEDSFHALKQPSRSRLTFIDRIDFGEERDPRVITDTLQQRLADAAGWPLNPDPLPGRRGGDRDSTMAA